MVYKKCNTIFPFFPIEYEFSHIKRSLINNFIFFFESLQIVNAILLELNQVSASGASAHSSSYGQCKNLSLIDEFSLAHRKCVLFIFIRSFKLRTIDIYPPHKPMKYKQFNRLSSRFKRRSRADFLRMSCCTSFFFKSFFVLLL